MSLAVRDRLEQMGATVIMTRETDDRETPKIVLDERVRMAVDAKPVSSFPSTTIAPADRMFPPTGR